MKVTFWGVRGSIPQPTSHYIKTVKYGGNTTCLTCELDNHTIIFDAGTGISGFGHNVVGGKINNFMLVFTHFHHDHVQGFPFFVPVFIPNKIVHYYSPRIMRVPVHKVLAAQFNPPLFPYRFENTLSEKHFMVVTQTSSIRLLNPSDESSFAESFTAAGYDKIMIEEKRKEFPKLQNVHVVVHKSRDKLPYEIGRIDIMENLSHPSDGTYIYKVTADNKSIVFATDIEGKVGGSARLIKFSKDVDYLIHDAQYPPEDYHKFQDFGHSTYEMACDHAIASNVKTLYLTHHDPWSSDEKLDELLERAKKYIKEKGGEHIKVKLAREGEVF